MYTTGRSISDGESACLKNRHVTIIFLDAQVKVVAEGLGLNTMIASGRKVRSMALRAKDLFRVHFFYQEGTDAACVHHAYISQWRPSWGSPRELMLDTLWSTLNNDDTRTVPRRQGQSFETRQE